MTQTASWVNRHSRSVVIARNFQFHTVVALASVTLVFLISRGRTDLAIVVASLPLAIRLLALPRIILVFLGASLPALMSISGSAGGLHVALSDVVLAAAALVILAETAARKTFPAVHALRPVAVATLPYPVFVALLLPFHPSLSEIAQSLQRYELFLVPLVVGAYAALRNQTTPVLQAFVISATTLAVAWPFDNFTMQKNPVGQMFANAILLLVALPQLRRLAPCLALLVPGLLYTESRGAIAATAIGLAVIVAFQANARPVITRVLPLALLAIGAFALMPGSLRARITTVSPGTNTAAAYSLRIRQQLSADARSIVAEHPVTGVGVGNYLHADRMSQTPVEDPHEVLLLEAAEGGYGFAAAFAVLIVGTALSLLGVMRRDALASAAVAVLLATTAHGLVDVYWVRGTPVLGWLLIGMVCGERARSQRT